MRRIGLAVVLTLFLAPLVAEGQQRAMPRVGAISSTTREQTEGSPVAEAFREGLRNLGYVEGRNVAIEWRYADGKAERFQELADDLVRLGVDVVVAANQAAVEATQKVTRTIPIVMILVTEDPVRKGFVASLARPGGNVTGFSVLTDEVIAKRLQLLREAVPKLSRVALLSDPAMAGIQVQVTAAQAAAQTLGMQLQLVEVRTPSEFDSAFAAMTRQGAQAIFVLGSSMQFVHRARIAELAAKNGLPSGCFLGAFAQAGCLMSYAPSLSDLWRRSTVYVDKILKGAKAADLPVEQPTKFDLIINLKTAKTLGLTIPQTLLLQATQVIE